MHPDINLAFKTLIDLAGRLLHTKQTEANRQNISAILTAMIINHVNNEMSWFSIIVFIATLMMFLHLIGAQESLCLAQLDVRHVMQTLSPPKKGLACETKA